ncbi:MAG: PBECR2 nuclease fold domain-containing protein [Thermotogae bacterium]|jgi:hypothetical protein|nr:PBECR2 nuclease fold domain-containing protein [Thermotogota bacterium]MCL5032530.1 PBECR2 nuclease fold domain-containing protein [Thermotogota bacterium]
MNNVRSKNDVPIRLTDERWFHITEEHSEMAGYYYDVLETVEEPDVIYEGKLGEYIAAREIEEGKYLVCVYKEMNSKDGFVITAFFTKRKRQLEKRRKIWQRKK